MGNLHGVSITANLRSIEADSFCIREVDLKRVLTLRYEEVKRAQKGYRRPGVWHPRRLVQTSIMSIAT